MTLVEEFISTLDKNSFGDENLVFSPFPNIDLAGRFPLDESIEKLFDKIYREAIFEEVLREAEISRKIIKKTGVYRKWYSRLQDKELKGIIKSRISRIRKGLFGEIRPERGVSEIYIDYGPGYRIYFTQSKDTVVILLCGGNKSTQDADRETACQMVVNLKGRLKK